MFVVFHDSVFTLESNCNRYFLLYDTNTLRLDRIAGDKLYQSIKERGIELFVNISVLDNERYYIHKCGGISGLNMDTMGWVLNGSGLKYRGMGIFFGRDNSDFMLSIGDSLYMVCHEAGFGCGKFKSTGFSYVELLEGIFFIHFYVGVSFNGFYDLAVAINKDGVPLGVFFSGDLDMLRADVLDDGLLALCARQKLLCGNGWWDCLLH